MPPPWEALDTTVEELYFQVESLESAHAALEIERRAYQELFEGGRTATS